MTPITFTPQERRITLAALMVVLLLSALDGTVVGTAMPRIIAQLHGFELFSWLTSAYMLTSTVLVPIYGKLSDLYGRKPILIIGVVVFLTGSMLCGMAGEFGDLPLIGGGMVQLIISRAIQGVGGAALFTSTFTIVADLFPPRERGKFMGLFGAVFGFAMVLGPLVGGFFTDHGTTAIFGRVIEGWRWVFYVNLPVGLIALFMILFKMPRLSHKATGKVDYLGAVLLIVAFVPLLLALTWGGTMYPWGSFNIIGLFAFAVVAFIGFLAVERHNKDAILPLGLFQNRVFSTANVASFFVNMAFMGIILVLPLFMQVVQGVDATNSGWSMLPFMGGLMMTSIGSGFLSSRTGRYKPFILMGLTTLSVGVILLIGINPDTTIGAIRWRMFIVGLGLGPSQSMFNVAIQNAVPIPQMGIATSASQFFRQIGSTIGVAIFGTLLTTSLSTELPKQLPGIPGMAVGKKINMGEAQSQAMNRNRIKDQIGKVVDAQYQLIDRAYHGDQAANDTVLASPILPEPIRAKVRDRAAHADIPVDQALAGIRQDLDAQAATLTATIERGTKTAFSTSIAGTFGPALAIVVLGLLVALSLPELPLRGRVERTAELQAA